ncbi:MAG: sulfatase-like hydrolase/transferase [Terracidiphilus sp.]|jgi:hypothetical protein
MDKYFSTLSPTFSGQHVLWLKPPFAFVRRQAPWILTVAFYAVLANLPYWLAQYEFRFVHHGMFCLQYLVVGLLALILPGVARAAILMLGMAADLLFAICESYYLPIRECPESFNAIHNMPANRICFALLVFGMLLLCTLLAARLPWPGTSAGQKWRVAACLVSFGMLLLAADSIRSLEMTGQLPNPLRAYPPGGEKLRASTIPQMVRIPVIRLAHMAWGEFKLDKAIRANGQADRAVGSAMALALGKARIGAMPGNQMPNLVIVVVESWGMASDPSLRDALVSPYSRSELLARYEVQYGAVPFDGSTIPAETRELCGTDIGFHILAASAAEIDACLPARLSKLGYHGIALHGMSGNLFDRSHWYKSVGFDEQYFAPDFMRAGLPQCPGAFPGICDTDLAEWIGQRLQPNNGQPLFIHWMTLNSHLPVPVPADLPHPAPCQAALSLVPDTPLCSWYQLVANVHESVAQLALGKLGRDTVFVIVGDHAPPFGNTARRSLFSQTVVPYVLLLPLHHPVSRPPSASRSALVQGHGHTSPAL